MELFEQHSWTTNHLLTSSNNPGRADPSTTSHYSYLRDSAGTYPKHVAEYQYDVFVVKSTGYVVEVVDYIWISVEEEIEHSNSFIAIVFLKILFCCLTMKLFYYLIIIIYKSLVSIIFVLFGS